MGMKLSAIAKRIPFWYQSGISVYLTSAPGRGKTETLAGAKDELSKVLGLNLGVVVLNGPLLTPTDAVGYLVPVQVDGRAESRYTEPFWFRTAERKHLSEYDGGIIVVDEADKMDVDTKKVIGEAALSGRLGPHILPKGWVVWMAGNRAKDRSGSTKELDHLINRRMHIEVTDDVDSWLAWAAAHNVSPVTMAFANQNVGIVFSDEAPKEQGAWCTPRSLVKADKHLQVIGFEYGPEALTEVSGMIGQGAATQLFNFMRLEREMPSFETIVADPKKAKLADKPDAQMLIAYSLAHRVDKDTAEACITYIERMPKEFSVSFMKMAIGRDWQILQVAALNKWVYDNASLMALINTK